MRGKGKKVENLKIYCDKKRAKWFEKNYKKKEKKINCAIWKEKTKTNIWLHSLNSF